MKKILVGVDGSLESIAALAIATDIAQAHGGTITVATAVEPAEASWTARGLAADTLETDTVRRKAALAVLSAAAAGIPSSLHPEQTVLRGRAASALAEQAEAGQFDLVVVGHRGRNGVARALLGSVADRLVQISTVPVLVAR
jgi:nucleotide-binding universal stress UspA family protein